MVISKGAMTEEGNKEAFKDNVNVQFLKVGGRLMNVISYSLNLYVI